MKLSAAAVCCLLTPALGWYIRPSGAAYNTTVTLSPTGYHFPNISSTATATTPPLFPTAPPFLNTTATSPPSSSAPSASASITTLPTGPISSLTPVVPVSAAAYRSAAGVTTLAAAVFAMLLL